MRNKRLTAKRILVNKVVAYLNERGVSRPTAFRWSWLSHEATGIGKEGLIATSFEDAFPAIRDQLFEDGGYAAVKVYLIFGFGEDFLPSTITVLRHKYKTRLVVTLESAQYSLEHGGWLCRYDVQVEAD